MTVAFHDCLHLARILQPSLDLPDLEDWNAFAPAVQSWHWERKNLSAVINCLSVALYDLFGADGASHSFSRRLCSRMRCLQLPIRRADDLIHPPLSLSDPYLEVLQAGCFKYFQLGGAAVAGPISLLSALAPQPLLLFGHFFCVAFYSIWCMFMHPQPVAVSGASPLLVSLASSRSPWADAAAVHHLPFRRS